MWTAIDLLSQSSNLKAPSSSSNKCKANNVVSTQQVNIKKSFNLAWASWGDLSPRNQENVFPHVRSNQCKILLSFSSFQEPAWYEKLHKSGWIDHTCHSQLTVQQCEDSQFWNLIARPFMKTRVQDWNSNQEYVHEELLDDKFRIFLCGFDCGTIWYSDWHEN